MHQRDQRAPDRKAGDKGFCAIDGIKHPDVIGILALVAEFLADDTVLGKTRLDHPPHHRLGAAIGFGDGVKALLGFLVLDAERGAEERQDGFAGGGRQAVNESGKVNDRHEASPSIFANPKCLAAWAEKTNPA